MTGLYLVTDRASCRQGGHSVPVVVEEACRAGVRWVQLREKDLSTRAFIELATDLLAITRQYGASLVINDRVDVALAVDADGVHVGQDDMPVSMVRSLLGPGKLIGLSINSADELRALANEPVQPDYLGLATVFPTGTKTDTASLLGLAGLADLCRQTTLPTFAIGGINADTIQAVGQTGVSGVAVVSAICAQPSPYAAARQLMTLLSQ